MNEKWELWSEEGPVKLGHKTGHPYSCSICDDSGKVHHCIALVFGATSQEASDRANLIIAAVEYFRAPAEAAPDSVNSPRCPECGSTDKAKRLDAGDNTFESCEHLWHDSAGEAPAVQKEPMREDKQELFDKFVELYYALSRLMPELEKILKAAPAPSLHGAGRQEGWEAAIEAAALAICEGCKKGMPLSGQWHEWKVEGGAGTMLCKAIAIRALLYPGCPVRQGKEKA
jgi:hypothetical protein